MIRKLLILVILGITVQGCVVAPIALLGPAASGFSTASLVQTGITTSFNYNVKKKTGKTITEHVLDTVTNETLKQTYLPISSSKEKNILIKSK
tara:strand:+ start:302 stop:580 length:279 start_codon:yes stop_codon:yes gene_type:complete